MSDALQTIEVPFYDSHADTAGYMPAILGMVVGYFTHTKLNWEQLQTITGYEPGRPAWTVKAWTAAANDYGLSVRMIEPFDYRRFASEGTDYLYSLYDNEEVEWYLANTNVTDTKPGISRFLATVRPECRRPSLADIDAMLEEGRLVFVALNGSALNGTNGMTMSAVLVVAKDTDSYIVHDPGLPRSYRQIQRDTLWQAMGGEQNTAEVTGFKQRVAGLRLDQYVVREKPSLSRAYASRLIAEGKVLVNGAIVKAGHKLHDHDVITIDYDEASQPEPPVVDMPVLYEDDDCIVVNKPAGLLTHNKGVRYIEATVASFVRSRISQPGGATSERAGIVHRLDRATSGVMIAAKTAAALSHLQKQFHDRTVGKTYAALVTGQLEPPAAIIDMPIERNPKAPATFRVGPNGKPSETYYETTKTSERYSLLELQPKTGRTHQLRVHLVYQRHPIVGDTLYGGEPADRLYLHAHKLSILLPNGLQKSFEAPVPPEFEQKLTAGT